MATKRDETPATVEATLREENSALRAQNDLILDSLVEMQERVKSLETQASTAPSTAGADDQQAALDAELAALTEEFKDYPAIQVFERRAIIGMDAASDIRLAGDLDVLADPTGDRCRWKLRWFNVGVEGRASRATAEGYVKVGWTELSDQDSIAAGDRTKPFVCKGERGQEMLYKIPRKLYDYKKRRDAARQQGLLTSESRLRDSVANRVATKASSVGDNASQAGDFAHAGLTMTVTEQPRERVTL